MKVKNIICTALLLVYMSLLIIWSKEVSIYVQASVETCINIIIPSLYIFMIISDFLISSNLYTAIGKPFSLISRYIFRIPEEYFSVFLIGSIGGYPVGAKLLSSMVENNKIDKNTAEDMLVYCYLSGPSFICGIVGVNIFSDITACIPIFTSVFLSNIIAAIIIGSKRKIPDKHSNKNEIHFSINDFIKSIYNGGKNILAICAIIIFFSSLICIFEKSGIISALAQLIDKYFALDYQNSIAIIKSSVEISNIILFEPNISLIPVIAALLSFGGLCVLSQIKGIVSPELSTKRFYFIRFILILSTYSICKVLVAVTYENCIKTAAMSGYNYSQNPPIPALFLLIMTILFLSNISMEKNKII